MNYDDQRRPQDSFELHPAKSLDGNTYYLLLSGNCINTFVTTDESLASFYIKHYGHRLYAKCKDGQMIL